MTDLSIDSQIAAIEQLANRDISDSVEHKVRKRLAEILADEYACSAVGAVAISQLVDLKIKTALADNQVERLAKALAKYVSSIDDAYHTPEYNKWLKSKDDLLVDSLTVSLKMSKVSVCIEANDENMPCPDVVLIDTRSKHTPGYPNPGYFYEHVLVKNGRLAISQHRESNPHYTETTYHNCRTVAALRRWCAALEISYDSIEV